MATTTSRKRSTPKAKRTMAAAKGKPAAAPTPADKVARFEHHLAEVLKSAARDTGSMVKGLGHDASRAGKKLARAVGIRLKAVRPPARKAAR